MTSLFLAERLRPFHACVGRRAGSIALSLSEARRLLPVGFVPVMPTLGPHGVAHLGVHERDGSIISPRSAEVGLPLGRARDLAVAKNKTEWLILRRRGRGDVAVPQ